MTTTLEGMTVTVTLELQGWFENPVPISSNTITVGPGNELNQYFSTRVMSDWGEGLQPVPGPSGLLEGWLTVDISGNSVYASFSGVAQVADFRIKIEGLDPTGVTPGTFQQAGAVSGVNTVYDPTYNAATKVLELHWYTLGYQPGTVIEQTIFYDNALQDAPIAVDDHLTVQAGQTLTNKNILSNDTDLDNLGAFGIVDPLSVTLINGAAYTPDQWMSLPGGGEIKVRTDGRLDFRDVAGEFAHLTTGQASVVSFNYTVSDSVGLTDTGSVSITVEGVNDTPTASNLNQEKAAIEDGAAVTLDDIVVFDPDDGESITATLTLSNVSAGTLTTGTFGATTSTFNASTGVWQVSGSVGDVNAALAALTFTPSEDNDQDFWISTQIRDAAGAGPADGRINFAVTPTNDSPFVTAPGAISVTEDVKSALTGISVSDVDAGSDPILLVFEVYGGTLAATAGAGVSVDGSGTGQLFLTGTIDALNAFIAAAEVTFTTGPNATSSFDLTVSANDLVGSSFSQWVMLNVLAVNDDPTITLPVSLSVVRDTPSTISGISFSDVDAGIASVTATFMVPHGSLLATSVDGVTVGGTPTALTLTGSLNDINAFISSGRLSYQTGPGEADPITLTVEIDDGGNTGSGGARTATSNVTISVEAPIPVVTAVSSASADGVYKAGDMLTLAVSFDRDVTVTGTPTLLLETGSVDRTAQYVSGSGSDTLIFTYIVEDGDLAAHLDYHSVAALSMNGGSIRGVLGDAANLILPPPGAAGSLGTNNAISIDGIAPAVPLLSLRFDSGENSIDRVTNDGAIDVANLEADASWEFSVDGGTDWATGTGTSFIVPAGSYKTGDIRVRQTDPAGNISVGSLSDALVIDATPPVLASAQVTGSTLVLTYSETLDAVSVPAAAAFSVSVSGNPVVVSGIAVDALARTVTLNLASPVLHGEAVTVTYADPTAGNDEIAIQDLAGNDASDLAATTVDNRTPAPPAPAPQPEPPTHPTTPSADLLTGSPGDDVITGGPGLDIFKVGANRADVTITRNPDGTITISHPDLGTDLLTDVELLRFNDQVEILNPPAGPTNTPNSGRFPEAAYLAQNPDVAEAVASGTFSSGLEHYLLHGASEGRLPQVAFDEEFYLSQYTDVAEAVAQGGFSSGYEHYLLYGSTEGRNPTVLFDEAWYLENNPDVAEAIANGYIRSAYEHFQVYGWKEGRYPSSWMDLSDYLERYPDVAASGMNPLDHFLNYGIHEGRTIQAHDSGLWSV